MLLHVYGVVRASSALPEALTGRAGGPVRRISDDELTVIASEVDEQARVGRADLLAHAHLLEAVAEESTVIPVQFGVVLPDEETVRREFLGNERARVLGLLSAFDGYVQVTVRASYDEESAMRAVMARRPDLVELREAAAGEDDGPLALQLGQAVAEELDRLREDVVELVVSWLQPQATGVAVNETRGAYEVANVSFLVERRARTAMDEAVAALDRELGAEMTVRYVGPQPPYAFLDYVVIEENSWA